jgi:hypothetical protein
MAFQVEELSIQLIETLVPLPRIDTSFVSHFARS